MRLFLWLFLVCAVNISSDGVCMENEKYYHLYEGNTPLDAVIDAQVTSK